jgi:hypothetical protein
MTPSRSLWCYGWQTRLPQHLKRAGKSRHGKGMRVHTEKQRAIDLLLLPLQTNGLTDDGDMPFIDGFLESGTAVPRGAEGGPLFRYRSARPLHIVGRDESRYFHRHQYFGWLSCKRTYFHDSVVKCRGDIISTNSFIARPTNPPSYTRRSRF